MALRASAAEVKAIVNTVLEVADIDPFLLAANIMVTDHLGDSSLSAEMLKEIERWLAAHLVSLRDPRAISKSDGGVSRSFETPLAGRSLAGTRYGQQVLLMDSTGKLAALMSEQRRGFLFLASTPDPT